MNDASANYEPFRGLTGAEARRRRAERPRSRRPAGSRSYADIVRTNVLTLFNGILAALLAVVIVLGDYRDGLFAGVLVANILIGVAQEVRAKRVLDRLALLVAPRGRVYRDAELCDLPASDVVTGDLVRVEPGDQVVADGRVVSARSLSLDESILTGESDAVERQAGDEVLSGAYCVAGTGDYLVEAVGSDSFAERLAAEARGTVTLLSPLQQDINRVLRATVAVMVPLAVERGEGRRVRRWVWGVLTADVAVALAGLALPSLRKFFELEPPTAAGWMTIAAAGLAGVLLVLAAGRLESSAAAGVDRPAPEAGART